LFEISEIKLMPLTNTEKSFERLFQQGLIEFKQKMYYEAHESWEELWKNRNLTDRIFIQGLIQLAASLFKVQTGNMRGAQSLLKKCKNKFIEYEGVQRGINVKNLKYAIGRLEEKYIFIKSFEELPPSYIPELD